MTITLKTLPQATAQEVFDQVATHLLRQMKQCIGGPNGRCQYRYRKLRCAAGCLIADDEYRRDWEGKPWVWLVVDGLVPGEHEPLIGRLQFIHDQNEPENWRVKLERVAREYGLEWRF